MQNKKSEEKKKAPELMMIHSVGDVVEIFRSNKEWTKAKIARVNEKEYHVKWVDKSNEYDKWVDPDEVRPYVKLGLLTKEITIQPGPIGISFVGNIVNGIQPNSQAQKLGIPFNWTILEVNGVVQPDDHEMIAEALNKTHEKGEPTVVLFQEPEEKEKKPKKETEQEREIREAKEKSIRLKMRKGMAKKKAKEMEKLQKIEKAKKKKIRQAKKKLAEEQRNPEAVKRAKALADFRRANDLENFDPNNLPPRTVVGIQKLKKKKSKKYNDKIGLITGLFDATTKRYPVTLYDKNMALNVKFENLVLVEQKLCEGDRIALKGFTKRPRFNGVKGLVIGIKEDFKYDVKLETDEIRRNVHRKKIRRQWQSEVKKEQEKRQGQEEKKEIL